jgi:hypothetical protein
METVSTETQSSSKSFKARSSRTSGRSQSDAAPGDAMDYVVNGNMFGGHAMLAVPAVFGETGVHSFMVSENGQLLEAVLGEDTLDLAADMTSYDPTGA